MGQDSSLRRKLRARRPVPRSLTVRLAAVAVCLLAAGAGIIVVAGALATRDALVRDAGQQLRGYAGQLARYPFLLTPLSRTGPGPPGLSGVAGAGAGNLSIEVRDARGQLVMRAGPAGAAGPGLPASAVRVLADHREAGPARVSRVGDILAVAEPVHYRAHHIPYAYSAEDFTLDVTSPAGRGAPGTLVVSLSLARVGQATGRLAVSLLAVGAIVVLAAGCLAGWMIRATLRPLTRLAGRAEAITASQPRAGCQPGPDRVAPALNAALSQLERARDPAAGPGPPTRQATGRQRQALEDTGLALRRPLGVLGGLAEYYRHTGQPGTAGFDRLLGRVAEETARIATLIDALEHTGPDQPGRPGPGENVGRGA